MFKQGIENSSNKQQLIEFITQQLQYLTSLARKIHELSPQLVQDQILDSVTLMEKRMVFGMDTKSSDDFHDYVADFYEGKMEHYRKELNIQLTKNKQLQRQLKIKAQNAGNRDNSFQRSNQFPLLTLNEEQSLKKQLIHSQQLIAENQQMIEAQNIMVNQLRGCLSEVEGREGKMRVTFQQKIKLLDEAIKAKTKRVTDLIHQFESEGKKTDRNYRQIELLNISLVQQKQALESELILKGEEIKILSRKIYDQNLMMGKYDRDMQLNEEILEDQRMAMNQLIEENSKFKSRLREVEKDYEYRIGLKTREVKELQQTVIKATAISKEAQFLSSKQNSQNGKNYNQLKNKRAEVQKLQINCSQLQGRVNELEKEVKKRQRKLKDNISLIAQYEDIVRDKDLQFSQQKELTHSLRAELLQYTDENSKLKEKMKQDFEEQFKQLANLNQEMLESVQNAQKQSHRLKEEYTLLYKKNRQLDQNILQLACSFEEAKNTINKVEQQRQDLDYLRGQLEIQLRHSERKNQEIVKICESRQEISRKNIELEENQYESKRLLSEKDGQLDRYKKMLKEYNQKIAVSEGQNIKLLKEELCRKEFMLRQTGSKLHQAQLELREMSGKYEQQVETMRRQIQQMERIIQDNFDHSSHSNRLIESL